MSISQEWMGDKQIPTNRKHVCESKIYIDIDIYPRGDNRMFFENNWSVTIDHGSIH